MLEFISDRLKLRTIAIIKFIMIDKNLSADRLYVTRTINFDGLKVIQSKACFPKLAALIEI
jgi:hypothetical protein